jgi:ribosomal protein L16 Arg81 hydroxylase
LETSEGFDDLASLDGLDEVIASLGLRASSLRMVQDGKTLPVSSYTTPPGSKSRTSDPLVIAAAVYERFSEGATIVIESLHRFWRPLTDFCRELELSLGHRLQVNAYVTPPGSQGFDVHRDGHDVFVLQVSGAKHWIVYDDGDEERVLIDQEIRRGAALYIPRGFPHAASAGSSASAHLTVGILTHDSIDVLREITKLAEREPIFKGPLPLGSTLDPDALREVVTSHVEELQAWLDKVDLDELTRRVARKTMSSSQSLVRGQLRQLELVDSINADTELAPRPGTTCTLFPGDTELRVLLVDRELQMPLAATVAMQAIAGRERMKVSDLHPYLTEDSALVLARRLVREGLLEVVVGD